MRKLLILFLLSIFSYSCGQYKSDQKATVKPDSLTIDTGKSDTKNTESEKWKYSQNENKMTSKIDYFAELYSQDLLQFSAPYDGGSTVMLMVRKREGENAVSVVISKGQFMVNSVDGEDIRLRFDDNKARTFNCTGPADDGTDMLFIHPANRIIDQLKKSKKLIIEANFYNEGTRQIIFNIDGFKWDH